MENEWQLFSLEWITWPIFFLVDVKYTSIDQGLQYLFINGIINSQNTRILIFFSFWMVCKLIFINYTNQIEVIRKYVVLLYFWKIFWGLDLLIFPCKIFFLFYPKNYFSGEDSHSRNFQKWIFNYNHKYFNFLIIVCMILTRSK